MNKNIDFLKQHKDSYNNIIKDIIVNNTNALVDEDIKSLLKTPPLDSMDQIRSILLSLAKKNKVLLNSDILKDILLLFRNNLLKCCEEIKNERNNELLLIIKNNRTSKDTDTIKINKKDFNSINKIIKNIIKVNYISSLDKILLKKINELFSLDVDFDIKNRIIDEFTKYMKNKYQKQLLDNIDIKILIKDTTLINSIKEQSERYIFTINNSRLLNDK